MLFPFSRPVAGRVPPLACAVGSGAKRRLLPAPGIPTGSAAVCAAFPS